MSPKSRVTPATPVETADLPRIGVGMLGYNFMGKAHSNAYRKIPHIFWPPTARIRLVAICGRTESAVAEAARRYGYEGYYTDWRDLVADEEVTILDNVAWHNVHADPCVAAAEHGKHVLCEKPLAVTAAEAKRMLDAVGKAGVKHMVSFNYRFAPAVRLAREIIERGYLGRLHNVRIRYLQDHQANPLKPLPFKMPEGKSGVLLGLGSHVIDMARFLVGEPRAVSGFLTTFNRQRPASDGSGRLVDVTDDDSFVATVEFQNGVVGTLEASYVCSGRKNHLTWEVNGVKGSLSWDLEDLNRLHVFLEGDSKIEGVTGFEDVLVTESHHPYHQHWWPFGHILGWEHLHTNLIQHFVNAVARDQPVGEYAATFEDGYKAAVIGDAIEESSRTGRRVEISYDF
ncbi:MAG: Gfo/Idh/MocA family oxidoreductase [Chloroflexi bacterium]|nr:Gfo/Idh/MocA family oxidoreductase [Chloroflexota bacterium]